MPAMSNLMRATLSISAAAALSRASGYLRWMTQAAILGTTLVANAYVAAALVPNLIYELILGGILYSIFIPVLIERRANHGEDDARGLTNALFTIILPLMGVVTLAAIVFAGPIVGLATNWSNAGDLTPEEVERTTELAVFFFRIFSVQMLFHGVVTIATGILQSHRRFFLPTFSPVLNNFIIIGAFLAYAALSGTRPTLALWVLAGGATLGVAVMALALVPTMFALGYVPRPRLRHPALLPTARLMGPMVIVVACSVAFQFFAVRFATEFNAAAQISYAFTIFALPFGVLAVAIATALMPELSEKHASGDSEGYRETFSLGLRTMAFIVVPASVGLISLSEPIVGLLYERGAFDSSATQTVATLLAAYSVGLLGYCVYHYLVRAFYSRHNTKAPAALNVVILVAYVGLAYALSRSLEAVGVVLGLSTAYAVLALLGLAVTRRELKRIDGRRLLVSLLKVLVAGAAMYAVARIGVGVFGTGGDFLGRAVVVAGVGGASLAAYLGAALLLRTEELGYARSLLRRKLRRKAAKSSGK